MPFLLLVLLTVVCLPEPQDRSAPPEWLGSQGCIVLTWVNVLAVAGVAGDLGEEFAALPAAVGKQIRRDRHRGGGGVRSGSAGAHALGDAHYPGLETAARRAAPGTAAGCFAAFALSLHRHIAVEHAQRHGQRHGGRRVAVAPLCRPDRPPGCRDDAGRGRSLFRALGRTRQPPPHCVTLAG